jgi:GT2 family glycosyltransferase
MCPVLNRWDLAQRLIDSIDHEVETLLIINNGMAEPPRLEIPGDVTQSVIFTPPLSPLGYGGAINFTIMQTPDLPWWLWASNDVAFHPGWLASIERRMNEATGPRIITGGFTWAAVNQELVDAVGLVDEWSFFPIYYDDNDYHQRCRVAGVEWVEDRSTGSTHGDGQHDASLTIRSDPAAHSSNRRSFMANHAAYLRKWGGVPGSETYETPWNSGLPVWVTRPDMAGRRDRRW